MKREILVASFIGLIIPVLCIAGDTDRPRSEEALKNEFSRRYAEKDVTGLLLMYDSSDSPPQIVAMAERMLSEYIKMGRPIRDITIAPLSHEDAAVFATNMSFNGVVLTVNPKPDRMMVVRFLGGSEQSAFRAPVAVVDGTFVIPVAKPKKE